MVAEVASPLLASHPPIKVFYYHYHNSIRSELDELSAAVAALENASVSDASDGLASLKRRVAFLDRVYSIHSSVEDEVKCRTLMERCRCIEHSTGYQMTLSGWERCLMLRCLEVSACRMLQVVYPALDLKVKNVTHAYSVEHEDEVRLSFVAVRPACGCITFSHPLM